MSNRRNSPSHRGRNDDYILEPANTDIQSEHHAPVKSTAKKIAMGLLIAIALFAIIALGVGFSYWISPRGSYSFPL